MGYSSERIEEIIKGNDLSVQIKFLLNVVTYLRKNNRLPAQVRTGVDIVDNQHANLFFYVPHILEALENGNIGTFMKLTEFITFYFCIHYSGELELQTAFQTSQVSAHDDYHTHLIDGWMEIYNEIHTAYANGKLADIFKPENKEEYKQRILAYGYEVLKHIVLSDIPDFGRRLANRNGDVTEFIMKREQDRKNTLGKTHSIEIPGRLLHPYNLMGGEYEKVVEKPSFWLDPKGGVDEKLLIANLNYRNRILMAA